MLLFARISVVSSGTSRNAFAGTDVISLSERSRNFKPKNSSPRCESFFYFRFFLIIFFPIHSLIY